MSQKWEECTQNFQLIIFNTLTILDNAIIYSYKIYKLWCCSMVKWILLKERFMQTQEYSKIGQLYIKTCSKRGLHQLHI